MGLGLGFRFEDVHICGIEGVDCSGVLEGCRWDAESDCDYAKGCWSFGIQDRTSRSVKDYSSSLCLIGDRISPVACNRDKLSTIIIF
jgi:hypothetical protein